MILCSQCWLPTCNCRASVVEIDDGIAGTISVLNKKGYTTLHSCGGHIDGIVSGILPKIYIIFNPYVVVPFFLPREIGRFWGLKRTNMELRCTIREARPYLGMDSIEPGDIKKIEDAILFKQNELYTWAKGLKPL